MNYVALTLTNQTPDRLPV